MSLLEKNQLLQSTQEEGALRGHTGKFQRGFTADQVSRPVTLWAYAPCKDPMAHHGPSWPIALGPACWNLLGIGKATMAATMVCYAGFPLPKYPKKSIRNQRGREVSAWATGQRKTRGFRRPGSGWAGRYGALSGGLQGCEEGPQNPQSWCSLKGGKIKGWSMLKQFDIVWLCLTDVLYSISWIPNDLVR